jgi:hypothetical protein
MGAGGEVMARKKTVIPAFPIESRLLALILLLVGGGLLIAGWWQDANEMVVLGGLCVAGALLALVADLLLGSAEGDDEER